MDPSTAPQVDEALENMSERDHVRVRTGMYIGGVGTSALAHAVHELIDNVADLWISESAKTGWVTIGKDQRVVVRDDGRGIPLEDVLIAGSDRKVPGVQAAFTEMRTGSKFKATTMGGLNGIGLKALTFMAREVNVEVKRDGKIYTQTFRNGPKGTPKDVLTIEPPVVKPYAKPDTGTTVRFLFDDSVFDSDAHIDGERIKRKVYNASRLCPGLVFHYVDERIDETVEFVSKRGLPDFIADLNEGEEPLFRDTVHLSTKRNVIDANGIDTEVTVECAFQPAATEIAEERGMCFTNLVHNPDGGTHLAGFRKGLTRALNTYFKKSALSKPADAGFDNSDVMQGLAFVLSLRMPNPGYESQTKKCLTTAWIDPAVAEMVADAMGDWLADHPNQAKLWYAYLVAIRKARLDMMAERKAVKAKIGGAGLDPLISKLARESTKDPSRAEIYFVEGDSAGGNAKQGRDRSFQAVLPFRGKCKNVMRIDRKTALEDPDVRRIATAVETGLGQHFDIEKLRYHKIIFMADADEDGGHIVMLWATMFFVMFPEILRGGHCYIAIPPLFSVYDYKTKSREYFYNMKELEAWQKGRPASSYISTRFKGLAEMSVVNLEETAMAPGTRRIKQIVVEDISDIKALITSLMGKQASERRAFMDANCRGMSTRTDVQVAS